MKRKYYSIVYRVAALWVTASMLMPAYAQAAPEEVETETVTEEIETENPETEDADLQYAQQIGNPAQ